MRKRSLLLKIVFFGLLLAGFVVMQYSWIQSLKKDKLEYFKSGIITGINGAMITMSWNKLTASSVSKAIAREFGDIPFEFSISSGSVTISSPGFNQKMLHNSDYLDFYYLLPTDEKKGASEDLLTVVIPENFAYKGMVWVYAASLFLTIMVLATFCCAIVLIERKQQLLYENRTNVIRDMMRQLETPLSTISIAAEALRDARVMRDSGKINYYQQVIIEENKRMNEQVNKMLQDICGRAGV